MDTLNQDALLESLTIELIVRAYGDNVITVESAQPAGHVSPPDAFPAVRVKTIKQDIDLATGIVSGEVMVVTYTNAEQDFTPSRADFADPASGRVQNALSSLPSGDLAVVTHGRHGGTSELPGGITARAQHWSVCRAVPQVPRVGPEPVQQYRVKRLAQQVAAGVSQPAYMERRTSTPASVADVILHETQDGGILTRNIEASLAIQTMRGTTREQALSLLSSILGTYPGTHIEGIGRCVSVVLESSEAVQGGVLAGVRFEITAQAA